MKKWMLFLYSISILLLGIVYCDNVFAKEVFPWYANINGETFNSGSTGYHNWYTTTLNPSASSNLNITIQSIDGNGTDKYNESFTKYPYVLIYFQTWNTKEQIGITKNDACSSSCFKNYNIGLKYIGDDASSGRHMYVMILQAMRWQFIEGSLGGAETLYQIQDSFTFTNNNTSSSTSKAFIFYNVILSDDANILTDDSINFNNILSNADNNRQQLQNTITNSSNSIINNQNSNTNNIINNQNSNQAQTNKELDDIQHQQEQTNQKLNDVNNSLNSEEAPSNSDVSNKTSEWAGKLAGTGPVSQMVLMPITLLNGYVNGFNSTCTAYNLGSLYGTNLTLPCVDISTYVGVSLWNVIDILFSGFMIYAIGKKFVKIFNDFTNLRDNQMDELYGGGK